MNPAKPINQELQLALVQLADAGINHLLQPVRNRLAGGFVCLRTDIFVERVDQIRLGIAVLLGPVLALSPDHRQRRLQQLNRQSHRAQPLLAMEKRINPELALQPQSLLLVQRIIMARGTFGFRHMALEMLQVVLREIRLQRFVVRPCRSISRINPWRVLQPFPIQRHAMLQHRENMALGEIRRPVLADELTQRAHDIRLAHADPNEQDIIARHQRRQRLFKGLCIAVRFQIGPAIILIRQHDVLGLVVTPVKMNHLSHELARL